MAGWLFADLLLGLTIIMLGAQAPPPSPTDPVTDTARFQPDPFQPLPDSIRPPSEEPSTEEPSTEEPSTEEPPSEGLPAEGSPDKEPLAEEPSAEKPPGKKAPEQEAPEKETSEGEHRPEEPAEKKRPVKEKPGPSPSPCTGLVGGVRAKPVTLSFRVTPGAADGVLAAQVRQELRRHKGNLAGRRVGMVLTFGSDSDGGASGGVQLATRVNTAIRETYPRIFGTAVTRNFHDLSAPSGSISMEIYFVTHGCSATSPGTPGH
ncbi:hypothetical protein ABZ260_18785 [Streptosporangium sp. NPDC006013]|uniref:hypothetical protein n=1 Tax=Streptosporangium sp. NPDC006013 TaxID=3155596 RepID=UPI0033AA2D1F